MSWRTVVVTGNAKLDYKMDYLVVRKAEATTRIFIGEIGLGDKTNREGHAAKVYFNALFGMDFSRSKDCAINAALNYGYGILLSCFNREVIANGYIT